MKTMSDRMVTAQRGMVKPRVVMPAVSASRASRDSTLSTMLMHRAGRAMHGLPDPVADLGEFLSAAHQPEIAARPRQRHLEHLLHHALAHHDDAVGEQNRLVEIMRDEEDRLLGARLDVEQL